MPIFGRKRISIEDVDVKLDGWHLAGRDDLVVQYNHQNGDVFSINFFNKQPDIGAPLNDVTGIRDFYRQMLISNNMALLECDVHSIGGLPSVYMLAKVPMEPRGFIFLASHTIPRQKHSFVLKYQAMESGMTGVREAVVLNMHPTPKIDGNTNRIVGWCADPYDSSLEYAVMRNKADATDYDSQFPDHPLSRTREFMKQLPQWVTLSENLLRTPEFKP